jgi:hypothetical protein
MSVHDSNDMAEHQRTYAMFLALTKWGSIVTIAVLALMAIFLVKH